MLKINENIDIMSLLNALSSSRREKGNDANIALARKIVETEDHSAIKELVENLQNKDKKIQGDCIKVLYETGYIKPELIAAHYSDFLGLLSSKNNRLVWGGMIALTTIVNLKPEEIYRSLELFMKTIEKGSVITIDCGVIILAALNQYDEYFDQTDPLLAEQLWSCPIKQLPMYMERSLICIRKKNKEIYQNIIEKRLHECDKSSQEKRLIKVLNKIKRI
jgi:hypothetical protein